MEIAVIIILVVAIILLFGFMSAKIEQLKKETKEDTAPIAEKLPYSLNDKILTDKELKFYNSLKPIADRNGYIILSKVRLADIFSVPSGTQSYTKWFNQIKAKHIDFLLCSSDTSPVFAIEVDDKTHERADRIKRDEFVNKLFEGKKVKLLRYKTWTAEQLESDLSIKTENSSQTATQCEL